MAKLRQVLMITRCDSRVRTTLFCYVIPSLWLESAVCVKFLPVLGHRLHLQVILSYHSLHILQQTLEPKYQALDKALHLIICMLMLAHRDLGCHSAPDPSAHVVGHELVNVASK